MKEPNWPTPRDVVARHQGVPASQPVMWPSVAVMGFVEASLAAAREAWLAENDDPSESLAGEVRQDGKSIAVRLDVPTGSVIESWFCVVGSLGNRWLHNNEVKGWPVIGQVPGTLAWDAASRSPDGVA